MLKAGNTEYQLPEQISPKHQIPVVAYLCYIGAKSLGNYISYDGI
jgi:hypothetical protein